MKIPRAINKAPFGIEIVILALFLSSISIVVSSSTANIAMKFCLDFSITIEIN